MLLKPPTKEKKLKNILFFDTESHLKGGVLENKEIEIHKPYLICSKFYYDYDTSDDYMVHYTVPEFQQYILMKMRKLDSITLIAHNAKYDAQIIQIISLLSENGYKISAFSFSNPFFIFARNKKTRKQFTIISSTNIFQEPLKKLGEKIGLEKLEFDHKSKEKFDMKKAVIYCLRDVEILEKSMISYFKFLDDVLQAKQHKITVASQSFNIFLTKFMKHDIDVHRFKNVVEIERAAYKGGRTECFRLGIFRNLYYYDINSMYPYEMLTKKYPTRLLSSLKFCAVNDLRYQIDHGKLLIAECNITVDEPVFAAKIDNKLLFPVGTFTTTLTTEEIKYALKKGLINYACNICIYDGDYIFKEFVSYFYNKRMEAKQSGSYYEHFFKIFLNSLYGKFGQRDITWECIEEIEDKMLLQEYIYVTEDAEGERKYKLRKVFNGQVWEQTDKGNARSAFVAIASHVTANARMNLWGMIEIAGRENMYYCDTDSLMVNKIGSENLEKAGMIDNSKLGKLKKEGFIKWLHIRNLKDYKITLVNEKGEIKKEDKKKGLSKDSEQIADNAFLTTHWNGFTTFIKSGSDKEYFTEKRVKKYSGEYTKGIVKDGYVYPIRLED